MILAVIITVSVLAFPIIVWTVLWRLEAPRRISRVDSILNELEHTYLDRQIRRTDDNRS